MKVDMRQYSFENVKIRDTTLVGGNFVRCNFNGSEFDNVYISGMNLSQTQLFNCKWKNIKIHELNKLDGHDGKVNQVCFSSDGKSLASCSDYNLIILWDVKTGKEKSKIRVKENVKSIFSIGKFVYLWNLKTGKEVIQIKMVILNDVNSICFSPNGTKIASGSEDKSICLWDGKTGQQKAKLDGHFINSLFSQFVSLMVLTLASGSYDESIRLWNVKASKKIIQSDSSYKDLLTQIKIPLQKSSLFANVNPDLTILRICQNPQLEAQGTLILQGQFINHQGEDLKSLFKSKGSFFLEDLKQNEIEIFIKNNTINNFNQFLMPFFQQYYFFVSILNPHFLIQIITYFSKVLISRCLLGHCSVVSTI
ncbi:unnamed protein product (macronuclear) [Paramecium tetraurelia]|uniref:Uncharacterized protein n=1 Tax=Paramecium tetraurelia TaxID=5888 RepID=A0CI65_PARTE|nr:uncharacterized protein GSPATT00007617001 [Paramecium tetraurelia]CAK70482.1 unnamed protein product [Paramecium tetraurelia]|eukprot:XP_001437879.1 hypothetical protein (macronuclear) [Paramecium tetraurelia strain d4-2]